MQLDRFSEIIWQLMDRAACKFLTGHTSKGVGFAQRSHEPSRTNEARLQTKGATCFGSMRLFGPRVMDSTSAASSMHHRLGLLATSRKTE